MASTLAVKQLDGWPDSSVYGVSVGASERQLPGQYLLRVKLRHSWDDTRGTVTAEGSAVVLAEYRFEIHYTVPFLKKFTL